MKGKDIYGEPETMVFPQGVAKVYRPLLSEEEKTKRKAEMDKAAIALIISTLEKERNKKDAKTIKNAYRR